MPYPRDASILIDNLKHQQREVQALGYAPWSDHELIFSVKTSIINNNKTVRLTSKIQDATTPDGCTFEVLCALVNDEARATQYENDAFPESIAPFAGFIGSPQGMVPTHPAYSPSANTLYVNGNGYLMHSPVARYSGEPHATDNGYRTQSPNAGFGGAQQYPLTGQAVYATRLVQGSPRGRSSSPGRPPPVCFEWSIHGTCKDANECRHAQTHTAALKAAHPEYAAMFKVFNDEQRARSRSRDAGGGRNDRRSPGRDGQNAGGGRGRSPGGEARVGTPRRR